MERDRDGGLSTLIEDANDLADTLQALIERLSNVTDRLEAVAGDPEES